MAEQPGAKSEAETRECIEIAGVRKAVFAGSDLARLADVLETAGGVVPRHGDRPGDIRLFKLVCGCNYRRIAEAAAELRRRVEDAMGNQGYWSTAAARIEEIFRQACPDADPGAALADLYAAGETGAVDALAGGDSMGAAFRRAAAAERAAHPMLDMAIRARQEAMSRARRAMQEPVTARVALVRWERAPCGLSGGYLRELAWMFDNLPEAARKLVDTRDGSAPLPEGIDAAEAGIIQEGRDGGSCAQATT